MPFSGRNFRRGFATFTAAGFIVVFLAFAYTFARAASVATPDGPTDDKTLAHVLDRVGYGPRAGDIDSIRRLGAIGYIDQQLHPERIDDSALTPRLSGLATVGLSSREIARDYFMPAQAARRNQK